MALNSAAALSFRVGVICLGGPNAMDGAEVVLRLFWLGIGLLERNNDFDGVVAPPDPSGALRRRVEKLREVLPSLLPFSATF